MKHLLCLPFFLIFLCFACQMEVRSEEKKEASDAKLRQLRDVTHLVENVSGSRSNIATSIDNFITSDDIEDVPAPLETAEQKKQQIQEQVVEDPALIEKAFADDKFILTYNVIEEGDSSKLLLLHEYIGKVDDNYVSLLIPFRTPFLRGKIYVATQTDSWFGQSEVYLLEATSIDDIEAVLDGEKVSQKSLILSDIKPKKNRHRTLEVINENGENIKLATLWRVNRFTEESSLKDDENMKPALPKEKVHSEMSENNRTFNKEEILHICQVYLDKARRWNWIQ